MIRRNFMVAAIGSLFGGLLGKNAKATPLPIGKVKYWMGCDLTYEETERIRLSRFSKLVNKTWDGMTEEERGVAKDKLRAMVSWRKSVVIL